jgi:hypothetical protein
MKPSPPPPGWIERLYRTGMGFAIPLTIVAGIVLLLTAREQQSAATAPVHRDEVVMAVPLEVGRPTIELHPAHPACTPGAAPALPCPSAAGIKR